MPKPLSELARNARVELGKAIVGHTDALESLFLTIVCGGHALIEGVPGLGKTLAVRSLARILRVGFRRVQCTPDLMPADVTGSNVLNMASSDFRLHQGPIFTDLLLVDEINRMPPRTQAALLEAMEERQVTIDGTAHPLSPLFTVVATQNPVEFEGTYPLPEAELDRFAVKIRIGYPEEDDERSILARHHAGLDANPDAGIDAGSIRPDDLAAAREEASRVRVEPALLGYIAALARRTRDWPAIALGASPRAAVHLMQIAKAVAATEGRDYLLPDDVKRMAPAVLRHRLIVRAEADLEGVTSDQVIADVLASVPVPK
ncbi:MAG TPA: MoxR family ATPase [Vicinamibacterales bacterium]|nr:MoxR family ATPase [Vicinamibacterales bacterium]